MKVVLDTCAVLWSVSEPESLTPDARKVLTLEDTEVFVSPISCAELACAVERKRVELDRHWRKWFRHFLDLNGWQTADIDLSTIEEAYSLPEPFHRDPADRIIVATARLLQCPIVTADSKILEYPHVATIW
ncbi:MAG: type II toxin-antitoxin system VapC family toxin [Deltaproteobacteria bacterium]|nr:MAG: type II toxin-antitoxin system VapC family toxin [Deltaproteobacteria bacterium]